MKQDDIKTVTIDFLQKIRAQTIFEPVATSSKNGSVTSLNSIYGSASLLAMTTPTWSICFYSNLLREGKERVIEDEQIRFGGNILETQTINSLFDIKQISSVKFYG